MAKSKTNTLYLNARIELIKCYEEKKISAKQLVVKFKCGKTQVYEIIKNKDKINEEWLNNQKTGTFRREIKKAVNKNLNRIVYDWFLNA